MIAAMDGMDALALAPLERAGTEAMRRRGRPRSDSAARRIREAFREELMARGFAALRLEHVAARAGVGKATIYRHWGTKQALALDVLMELAAPHIVVPDMGDTRAELLATVSHPLHAITRTDFGPVMRALLSQIAIDPRLGDPFRASVVRARRDEVTRVILRGIARGDLHPGIDLDVATELLVGPTYFRLVFGGTLDDDFADRIVDAVMAGYVRREAP